MMNNNNVKYLYMEKHLRRVLAIIDENQDNIREGDYIEICDNLKKIRKINSRERIQRSVHNIIKFVKYIVFIHVSSDLVDGLRKKKLKDNDV